MNHRNNKLHIAIVFVFFFFFLIVTSPGYAQVRENGDSEPVLPAELEKTVIELMEKGNIPGLCMVIIRGDKPDYVKGFGYADRESKTPVTSETLFELASCSKAFTALAVLRLESEGLLNLDAGVSDYLPWFYAEYDGARYVITLRQLLHHTSGIPPQTISVIPISDKDDAIQETARRMMGVRLNQAPGSRYQYATTNYVILGAIIETVTGKSFEQYMEEYVFKPLDLQDTTVGRPKDHSHMAAGYKPGFFSSWKYDAPAYRGNNPAAYVVSNGKDMARWLKIQMGLRETALSPLVRTTHSPDLSVTPQGEGYSSYGMGWIVNQYRRCIVYHAGINPNFSSYIAFYPEDKIGIALLANCGSNFTNYIGGQTLSRLMGKEPGQTTTPRNLIDLVCSVFSIILGIYLLGILAAVSMKMLGVFKGQISLVPLTWKKLGRYALSLVAMIPYLWGIYLVPRAIAQVSWQTATVWAPSSFRVVVGMLIIAFAASFIFYFASLIFPNKNKYINQLPVIIVLGILTGLANTAVLFLITTSFFSSIKLGYLLYYFLMAYSIHVIGAKLVQTRMINITNNITVDLREDLIRKLLWSRFQRFETLQDGRILTTLNTDTAVLARSAGMIVGFITSVITAVSAFFYLFTISFNATLVVLLMVVIMAVYYYIISRIARRYMEEARDTQNIYMRLLNHMIQGFRELSIHWNRKKEFEDELMGSCREFRDKSVIAAMKYLHSGLIGNSFVMIILGMLSIVVPRVTSGVNTITLISFVMILLYLLGPVNGILGAIPGITRLRISWDRIKGFVNDIEAKGAEDTVKQFVQQIDRKGKSLETQKIPTPYDESGIESIKVENLVFQYKNENEDENFTLGPIDLEAKKGEIFFIIGGNGSGKTTLANLLTGLYQPDKGCINIDGKEVPPDRLGEYFSTVFSNYHLFDRLYEIDVDSKRDEAAKYLKILKLIDKVRLKSGGFSTLNLSGGQRKRLALLLCYLEDRPIYLFDEVAADQDPEFRKFFYRELLARMKERGKIVIAITHDDHYFDVADSIIKLHMGKVEFIGKEE